DDYATNSAELYDPATGGWTATGAMNSSRSDHTATLLADGKVLVTGGYASDDGTTNTISSAELYDEATGTWTTTGPLNTQRAHHAGILLPNGKVLVAGGSGTTNVISSAELYDPATRTW